MPIPVDNWLVHAIIEIDEKLILLDKMQTMFILMAVPKISDDSVVLLIPS